MKHELIKGLIIINNIHMKARIQLIQNSPLHKVPTVFLTIYRTQFIFNVIPTLLRHRKNHKINLFNSSHIFFTKNSIQALGGLPNYLLFRSAVQNSNSALANKINIYGDGQIFDYLQKLRFKLGYKILRFSYCSWQQIRNRIGISRISLLNQLKNKSDFPKIFVKIDDFIKSKYKKDIDYYQSSDNMHKNVSNYISIGCKHFHHDLIDIYPLSIKDQNITHTGFICIPTLRKQGEVDIEQFINKTSITKQASIKEFVSLGFINKDGKTYRKSQFLFKNDYKPKDILIFHYISSSSIAQYSKNSILNNYLSNNNETGVIIHIVQDLSLIQTPQFKSFISKFKDSVKHLWFNKDLHSQHYWQSQNLNYQELRLWSITFPNVFHNVCLHQKIYTSNWNNKLVVSSIFPLLNHFLYRKLYNLVINDYKQHRYEKRQQVQPTLSKLDVLKALLLSQEKLVKQLQQKCNYRVDDKFHPKITFLGTASSMPTPSRNTLGILISLNKQINIILDCGQGTFQQLTNHLHPQVIQKQILKVRVIFITHIHSDHNLGILNFISQRNKMLKRNKKDDKLFLIIPFNVYNWYEQYNRTIEDLTPGCHVLFTQILENSNVQAIKSDIQMISNKSAKSNQSLFGKKKNNKQDDGKFCKNQTNILSEIETSSRTKQLVLKELPSQLKVLKSFQQCLSKYEFHYFKPIKVIHCPQSYGIVIQNDKLKVAYSGDTRPSKQFEQAAKNCNLMIHQATFNDKDQNKASQYLHSTVFEAIQVGKKANALKLALTHYNQDFQYPYKIQYKQQYQEYFKNNTIFSLDHLNLYLDSPMNQLPSITQFLMRTDIEATNKAKKEVKQINKYE